MDILTLPESLQHVEFNLDCVIDIIMFIEQHVINEMTEEYEYLLNDAEFMRKYFPWKAAHCYEYVKYIHLNRTSDSKTFADAIIDVCTEMNNFRETFFSLDSLDTPNKKLACRQYFGVFKILQRIYHGEDTGRMEEESNRKGGPVILLEMFRLFNINDSSENKRIFPSRKKNT